MSQLGRDLYEKQLKKKSQELIATEDTNNIKWKHIIIGVPPLHQKYYQDNSSSFKCLDGKNEVLYSQVNDDYCDCEDASDEPSTAACSNGLFFCSLQVDLKKVKFVRSSQVNDGICDCCDGSDEWKKIPLPFHVVLSEKIQSDIGIFQVPCRNRC